MNQPDTHPFGIISYFQRQGMFAQSWLRSFYLRKNICIKHVTSYLDAYKFVYLCVIMYTSFVGLLLD